MSSQIATVDTDQNVALHLSAEMVHTLGLRSGSHLGVILRDGQIVLQPILADSLDELHGIFSSSAGLVEELQQERRKESW